MKILLACFISTVVTTAIIPVNYSFGWIHLIVCILLAIIVFKTMKKTQAEVLETETNQSSREIEILDTEADRLLRKQIRLAFALTTGDTSQDRTECKAEYEKVSRELEETQTKLGKLLGMSPR